MTPPTPAAQNGGRGQGKLLEGGVGGRGLEGGRGGGGLDGMVEEAESETGEEHGGGGVYGTKVVLGTRHSII